MENQPDPRCDGSKDGWKHKVVNKLTGRLPDPVHDGSEGCRYKHQTKTVEKEPLWDLALKPNIQDQAWTQANQSD
jgi:hypothetical protein